MIYIILKQVPQPMTGRKWWTAFSTVFNDGDQANLVANEVMRTERVKVQVLEFPDLPSIQLATVSEIDKFKSRVTNGRGDTGQGEDFHREESDNAMAHRIAGEE